MVAGFADSCIRVWALTQRKLRSMKSSTDLALIDKEADDIMERIMDDRYFYFVLFFNLTI